NLDLDKKALRDAALQLSCPSPPTWLPCQALSLTGSAHGPWTNLVHAGNLEVTDFRTAQFKPLQLHLAWQGEQLHFKQAEFTAKAGAGSLMGRASVVFEGSAFDAMLEQLVLSRNESAGLELETPVRLRVSPGPRFAASIDSFHWAGKAGDIAVTGSLAWPDEA